MKSRRYAFCSNSESETAAAGRKLAGVANGVICLIGELGTGKTVFTKGIAEGLGIDEYITSPTFNIVNVYEKDGYIFNHMDAYRITNPEMLHDIGFEEIIEEGKITVIEWADMIIDYIDKCSINVQMLYGSTPEKRIIIIEASEEIVKLFSKGES